MKLLKQYLIIITTLFFCIDKHIHADQFHYKNFLIGDRALGLGGSFAGIADDASGAFYNPAGLAYASSNDISGSANAIYDRTVTYKNTLSGSDFIEKSGGISPSYFGGLQKLDNLVKGLVFAFGIYVLDSDMKNQNDLIENKTLNSQGKCAIYKSDGVTPETDANGKQKYGSKTPPNVTLDRFHRTVNQQAATDLFTAALGYRLHPRLALGFGVNYLRINELAQVYQDVRTQLINCKTDGDYSNYVDSHAQNDRIHLTASALQPVIGIQYVPLDKLTIGLTFKSGGNYLSQSLEKSSEIQQIQLEETDQANVDKALGNLSQNSKVNLSSKYNSDSKSSDPLGSLPYELKLGLSLFATPRLLMTFDTDFYSDVDNSLSYSKEAVTNFSAGTEYYVTPAIPLRIGVFTNNDSRPKLKEGKKNQRDKIDYIGASLGLSWVQPSSQIGGSIIIQKGEGKAQKIINERTIQEVEATSIAFAFSASHSF